MDGAAWEGAGFELQDVSHRARDHDAMLADGVEFAFSSHGDSTPSDDSTGTVFSSTGTAFSFSDHCESTSDDGTDSVLSSTLPPVPPYAAAPAAAAAAVVDPDLPDVFRDYDDDGHDGHDVSSDELFDADPVFGTGEPGLTADCKHVYDEEHVDTPASLAAQAKRRKSAADWAGPLPKRPESKDELAVGSVVVGVPIPRCNFSRYTHGALPFDLAEMLLVTEAFASGGKRPDHLQLIGSGALGMIYKDGVKRRRRGLDFWECKGGNKGSRCMPSSTTKGRVVRRMYGSVKLRSAPSGKHTTTDQAVGNLPKTLKFHQYTIEQDIAGASSPQTSIKLFHVVPAQLGEHPAVEVAQKGEVQQEPSPPVHPKAEGNQDDEDHSASLLDTGSDQDFVHSEEPSVRSISGVLQLQNRRGGPWITFHNSEGLERGCIKENSYGVVLCSASGDFAEWHRRSPSETQPFEEGDVVGLDKDGLLTRRTGGAHQVGVISRRAIIEGSAPPSSERIEDYDLIAYSGRVGVRVRGPWSAGDFLTPSGVEDGTAVAVLRRPSIAVGRALNGHVECRKDSENLDREDEPVQLVDSNIIGPADSVRPVSKPSAVFWCCAMGLVVFLAVAIGRFLGLAMMQTQPMCTRIELPHGVLDGVCNGLIVGGVCSMTRCDPGFAMVPASTKPTLVWFSEGFSDGMLGHNRTCVLGTDGSGEWSGPELRCVQVHCPATVVSAQAFGVCEDCGNVDAEVAFPSAIDDGGATRVSLPCPPSHIGMLHRTCGGMNAGADGGAITGSCQRKSCPQIDVHLDGWIPGLGQNHLHTVQFPKAAEGTGRVSLPCPSSSDGFSSYRSGGMVSRSCANDSNMWTEPENTCEWISCNETCIAFHDDVVRSSITARSNPQCSGSEQVPLPQWSIGEDVRVPCCRTYTHAGSCASAAAGLGVVRASCGNGPNWTVTGTCEPPEALQLSLRVGLIEASPNSHTVEEQVVDRQQLYTAFQKGFGSLVSKATQGRWSLPSLGVLGTLAVSWRGGATHHLLTSPGVPANKHSQVTLTAGLLNARGVPQGRVIAAMARVSCRQLGFGNAVLATNCRSIRSLTSALPGANSSDTGGLVRSPWSDAEVERLCPLVATNGKHTCPVLKRMEISPNSDNLPLGLHGDNYGGYSSCVGNESHIGQCFRHSLEQADTMQARYCDQTIVVACGLPANGQHADAESELGVWVVGEDAASSNIEAPAILVQTDYVGPECGTTRDAWCWGKFLPIE